MESFQIASIEYRNTSVFCNQMHQAMNKSDKNNYGMNEGRRELKGKCQFNIKIRIFRCCVELLQPYSPLISILG